MAVGWGLLFIAPEVKVSDFYGFGLSPSHTDGDKKCISSERLPISFRITAQISAVSVIVANGIGFALTLLPTGVQRIDGKEGEFEAVPYEIGQMEVVLRRAFIDCHAAVGVEPEILRPDEIYYFEKGVSTLTRDKKVPSSKVISQARRELSAAGFRLDFLGVDHAFISPFDPATGRPLLLLDLETES